MIRRFVNLVAANDDRCAYSLHQLDVATHLFYPSTAEAEAANAKEEDSNNGGGGDKPRKPSRIERLRRLPEPIARFQQFRPSNQSLWSSSFEGPRINLWSPSNEMFALLGSRGRIFHATEEGHAVLYDAGDDDDSAGSITTLPNLDRPNGHRPIAIPIVSAADGREKESLYVMTTTHHSGRGHHSFQVLDVCKHPPKWEPLPPPPFAGHEAASSITSFTVVDGGSTICVSTREDRTYCFDTRSHRWWHAGDWMLPFDGRADYVPELDAWLGLRYSSYHGHLCASSDLRAAVLHAQREPPKLQHVWEDLSPPPAEVESLQLSRRFNEIAIERRKEWKLLQGDLINLGGGRFCVAKVFRVQQVVRWGFEYDTEIETAFVVLTGVEVLRDGESRELRMVKNRSKRYMFTNDTIQWVL